MLPFGSITSIIPLFILAFAYVIYFSASLLNKHNATEHNRIAEDDKFLISAELSPSAENQYPDFRYIGFSQIDEMAPTNQEKLSYNNFCCTYVLEIQYGNITPQHRISGFSPRPPPVF